MKQTTTTICLLLVVLTAGCSRMLTTPAEEQISLVSSYQIQVINENNETVYDYVTYIEQLKDSSIQLIQSDKDITRLLSGIRGTTNIGKLYVNGAYISNLYNLPIDMQLVYDTQSTIVNKTIATAQFEITLERLGVWCIQDKWDLDRACYLAADITVKNTGDDVLYYSSAATIIYGETQQDEERVYGENTEDIRFDSYSKIFPNIVKEGLIFFDMPKDKPIDSIYISGGRTYAEFTSDDWKPE